MNNIPQFKIHGKERRELKKELSELKAHINMFWYHHQLDKDMASFYGGTDGYPMSDEDAQKRYDEKVKKVEKMEEKLSVPYT